MSAHSALPLTQCWSNHEARGICQRSFVLSSTYLACASLSLRLLTNIDIGERVIVQVKTCVLTAPETFTHNIPQFNHINILTPSIRIDLAKRRSSITTITMSAWAEHHESQESPPPSIVGSVKMIMSRSELAQDEQQQQTMASEVLSHSLSPSDPDNPMNWPLYRKIYVSSCGFLFAASV